MSTTVTVTCEQAVYGSFPFGNEGYRVLASSPGCRPEWIAAFTRFCRELGQPPSESAPCVDQLLFARKIPAGPWVVALGSFQGRDDRGRPGAWAFHGLFLSSRDYLAIGATPFPLRPHLMSHFTADAKLTGVPILVILPAEKAPSEKHQAKIRWIARGKKLRRISDSDTFGSTETFWDSLGTRTKKKRCLTTWAFRSDTPYHWACIGEHRSPLNPEDRDESVWYFNPNEITPDPCSKLESIRRRLFEASWKLVAAGIAAAFFVSLFVLFRSVSPANVQDQAVDIRTEDLAPRIDDFRQTVIPKQVHDHVREQLSDWAERLDSDPLGDSPEIRTDAARIARGIRYDGPLCMEEIRRDPAESDEAERVALANAYDFQIRMQANFRPWPDHGAKTSETNPCHVLASLAWCVRNEELEAEAEKIRTVNDARAWFERFRNFVIPNTIPSELPVTGLESRFPELIEYRLHLSRLIRMK